MWRQQHVVGHHAYTNLAGGDPDICSAADPDLRCITPAQAPQPHHVRSSTTQHLPALPSGFWTHECRMSPVKSKILHMLLGVGLLTWRCLEFFAEAALLPSAP